MLWLIIGVGWTKSPLAVNSAEKNVSSVGREEARLPSLPLPPRTAAIGGVCSFLLWKGTGTQGAGSGHSRGHFLLGIKMCVGGGRKNALGADGWTPVF